MTPNSCMECEHFHYKEDTAKCLKLKKKNRITDLLTIKPNCPLKKGE